MKAPEWAKIVVLQQLADRAEYYAVEGVFLLTGDSLEYSALRLAADEIAAELHARVDEMEDRERKQRLL